MALPPLYDRAHDSIVEFERAAAMRYREASLLDRRSYKLAGIYLFGYSIEMRVKAAYFQNSGFVGKQRITAADRDTARAMWQVLGLVTRPGAHDVLGWAQMAVAARATTSMTAYGLLGQEVVNRATRVAQVWSEILRYRTAAPLRREWIEIRAIAGWFQANYHRLS
jgi:hypothetical protein